MTPLLLTHRSRRGFTRRQTGLTLCITALLILAGGGLFFWRYADPPLDRYSPILQQAAAHQLKVNDLGCIDLSKTNPGLTPHNEMFITYNEDGSYRAMFPLSYGEGFQVNGLLYTSRPLSDSDTHHRTGAMNFDEYLIRVATYENLVIDKRINENWYRVSYKLH